MNNIDKIFVISYVKHEDHRNNIIKQLNYHSINDFEFYYTYNVSEKIIANPNFLENKYISVSYAHYDLLKRCYELGYERIMVFEDDVLFLKDNTEFNNILTDAINRTDNIVLLDYKIEYLHHSYNIEESRYWFALQSGYIVDRKGMEFYIDNFEKSPRVIDHYLVCDYINEQYHTIGDALIWYRNNQPTIHQLENPDTIVSFVDTRLCYQNNLIYDTVEGEDRNLIDKNKYFSIDEEMCVSMANS